MDGESLAEQLFFVTIRIETVSKETNSKTITGVGTGFVISYRWNDKEGLFLVTNKHVLKDAEKIRFFFIQSDGKNPVLGKTYNIEMGNVNTMWYGHPNDNIDVAIMLLSGVFDEIRKRNWQIFYKTLTKDLVPTPQQEKDLDAIEAVTFVGYPNGIYDTANYLPVIRTGTTATPPSVNYKGLPQFLIDASVFPGSSGSPVFILNRGSYPNKKGVLIAESPVEHEYPHCWRCHNPVVFRITFQWFFKVEDLRDKILKGNKKVHWVPDTANNSYEAWIRNLKDNSVTRQRYWGTPIPIWKCSSCHKIKVIGSRQEIEKNGGKDS